MTAICNGYDLSKYVAQGYSYEREPQISDSITALDGTDYTAKIRDRVRLTVPIIPLTLQELTEILQLFPSNNAYVDWTYYDPYEGGNHLIQAKYDTRSCRLKVRYENGVEYWEGLVIKLMER